jgi:hypothetical protein
VKAPANPACLSAASASSQKWPQGQQKSWVSSRFSSRMRAMVRAKSSRQKASRSAVDRRTMRGLPASSMRGQKPS